MSNGTNIYKIHFWISKISMTCKFTYVTPPAQIIVASLGAKFPVVFCFNHAGISGKYVGSKVAALLRLSTVIYLFALSQRPGNQQQKAEHHRAAKTAVPLHHHVHELKSRYSSSGHVPSPNNARAGLDPELTPGPKQLARFLRQLCNTKPVYGFHIDMSLPVDSSAHIQGGLTRGGCRGPRAADQNSQGPRPGHKHGRGRRNLDASFIAGMVQGVDGRGALFAAAPSQALHDFVTTCVAACLWGWHRTGNDASSMSKEKGHKGRLSQCCNAAAMNLGSDCSAHGPTLLSADLYSLTMAPRICNENGMQSLGGCKRKIGRGAGRKEATQF
eukprot:786249-Pelagomonas_calceolata.AAC.5